MALKPDRASVWTCRSSSATRARSAARMRRSSGPVVNTRPSRNQVMTDVRSATIRVRQAEQAISAWRDEIVPSLADRTTSGRERLSGRRDSTVRAARRQPPTRRRSHSAARCRDGSSKGHDRARTEYWPFVPPALRAAMYRSCYVVIVMRPDGRMLGQRDLRKRPTRRRRPLQHPRTEAEISTIRLTADAVKRLGVQTVAVKTDVAAATRTLGGEVVVPEGRGVVVTAPVAGTLTGASGLRAGARVGRGDRLMTIAPLVSAERDQRIEAQRAVTTAEAEELAARQRLQRLEQLLKDGAASVRSVEEARAQHQVSLATLTAARERLAGASKNPVGAQGELVVSAPFDGIVQTHLGGAGTDRCRVRATARDCAGGHALDSCGRLCGRCRCDR